MTSLRASIATLPRYTLGDTLNVSEVAEFIRMERPVSIRSLVTKIGSLPDSVPFHSTIETGTALGGEVTLTLNRDGSYRFRGFMRASGALSFSFRISAVVRSASKEVMVAAHHTGKVFGTDTPGDRQNNWDEVSDNPERMKLVRNVWPDISGGTMVVNRSTELSGVLGEAVDIVKDIAEFLLVAETLGAGLAICLVIGSELGDAGVTIPGLGGVVGLGIVGGSLFIWGPLAIGPAILIGVAAGAVVDSMVKIRRLLPFEEDFAREVFGDSIDFERVRLTNLSGIGTRPFTMPTVDNTILINIGNSFDAPTTAVFNSYPFPGQLLIHELTHVWQIQHASLKDGYVPGWLCRGIVDSEYTPAASGAAWSSYGVEAQGSIVDRWFGGNKGSDKAGVGSPEAIPMSEDSEYFRYIRDNIRLGES
jgi:hypothetical protein